MYAKSVLILVHHVVMKTIVSRVCQDTMGRLVKQDALIIVENVHPI